VYSVWWDHWFPAVDFLPGKNGVDMPGTCGKAVIPNDLCMPDPLVDHKGSVRSLLLMSRQNIGGRSAVKTRI